MTYGNYIKSLRENDKTCIAEIIRIMEESSLESVDFPNDDGNEVTAYVFEDSFAGATCEIIQGIRLKIDNSGCKYIVLVCNGREIVSVDCHEGTMPYIHAAVIKTINEQKIKLLEQHVDTLGFKTHVLNTFRRENIETLADLCMCSHYRMRKVRGISLATVNEIRMKLIEMGLDFNSNLKMLGFYPKRIYLHEWMPEVK